MQGLPLLDRRKIGTECRVPLSWIGEGNGLNAPSAWKGQNAGFPLLGYEN